MTIHVSDRKMIEAQSLAQLFTDARTHNAFLDKPVQEDVLLSAGVRALEMASDEC